jgi:hypothetical protein
VARHAAFDIVDVLEIVPLSLFMEFAPAGRRAGEIDRRTDLDRFGLGRRRSAASSNAAQSASTILPHFFIVRPLLLKLKQKKNRGQIFICPRFHSLAKSVMTRPGSP